METNLNAEIQQCEQEILSLIGKLNQLRKQVPGTEVTNYSFKMATGTVSLLELFEGKDRLIAIHNMGQACRYCTLWADGFNGFVPHLENAASFVVLSKDEPAIQRRLANARGWRFRMASHQGSDYLQEQSVVPAGGNMPGVVCYRRDGDKIFRTNSSVFGPGDIYCSFWSLLGLAGLDDNSWTPQYSYWGRPKTMEDGGANLCDGCCEI